MPRSNGMRTAPSDVSKSQRSPLAVVIGAFPPPRHGQAVSNEAVVHRLQAAGWLVSEVDTSPGLLVRSFTYYARRAATGGRAVTRAWRLRRSGAALVYGGLSGGPGLLLDALLLRIAAGPRTQRVIVHHHSFAYITERQPWMSNFLRLAPRRAQHVFLCERMRHDFVSKYGLHDTLVHVVGNLALRGEDLTYDNGQPYSQPAHPPRQLRIGFLGTLSREKGYDVFRGVAQAVRAQVTEDRVAFLSAGHPTADFDENDLMGDSFVDYAGVLDGTGVRRFLRELDLLLFPSRYVNEAQPNVILEAIAHGVPVMATNRGCVADLLSPELRKLIVDTDSFRQQATDLILRHAEGRGDLTDLASAALAQYRTLQSRAIAEADTLAALINL